MWCGWCEPEQAEAVVDEIMNKISFSSIRLSREAIIFLVIAVYILLIRLTPPKFIITYPALSLLFLVIFATVVPVLLARWRRDTDWLFMIFPLSIPPPIIFVTALLGAGRIADVNAVEFLSRLHQNEAVFLIAMLLPIIFAFLFLPLFFIFPISFSLSPEYQLPLLTKSPHRSPGTLSKTSVTTK
ncbi:MAG: hypothetical protein LBE24_00525 [Methylobacillus sp.]|jgi:hypothetical protein|nr:hypothetical protein [Methylobacillus sp.]